MISARGVLLGARGNRLLWSTSLLMAAAAATGGVLLDLAAAAEVDGSEEKGFYAWPMTARVVLCLATILLSSMFCGLTIGLLGMDTITLEIIASAGEEPERTYASKILPIRHLGHQLLASLLLANILTLVLTSQLVAAIVQSTELVNFIVGTVTLLIFAEILPVAYCNKGSNGLKAGVASLPIIKLTLLIVYPVAKPLGMMLDCLVCHDAGQLYDKNTLRKLIRVHYEKYAEKSGINQDELRMMLGALGMNETTIDTAMTPLDCALMLEASQTIDAGLQRKLWEYGKSRVPVYAKSRSNIIGVLYVKDLINVTTLRGDEAVSVRDFIIDHPRDVLLVQEKTLMQDALKIFESHYTQLLFVERTRATPAASPLSPGGVRAGGGSPGYPTDDWGEDDGRADGDARRQLHRSGCDSGLSPGPANSARECHKAELTCESLGSTVAASQSHVETWTRQQSETHTSAWRGSTEVSGGAAGAVEVARARERQRLATPEVIPPHALLEESLLRSRQVVGIVTLEDIIECLIASEIYDEDEYNIVSDCASNGTNSDTENELLLRSVSRSFSLERQPVRIPRVNFYSYSLKGGAMEEDDDLTEDQKWALASYMTRAYVFFASWSVSKMKFLLDEVGDRRIFVAGTSTSAHNRLQPQSSGAVPVTAHHPLPSASAAAAEPARTLYTAGTRTRVFTLLLSGGVDVVVGPELFRTELRSFASLGEEVFSHAEGFTPDYTATVSRTSRLLCISHEDMYRVERRINAIRRQRRRPPVKLTTFDGRMPPVGAATLEDSHPLQDGAGGSRRDRSVDVVVVEDESDSPVEVRSSRQGPGALTTGASPKMAYEGSRVASP